MEVLLVEPGKEARLAEIGADLKSLQAAVGGYIEAAYFFADAVALICTGKSRIENASAGTVYRLAKALGTTADELIAPSFERPAFGIFKGNVCHTLKEQGDIQFIINTLESGEIRKLFSKGWYEESLYLLAMLDYVSRVNHVPLCSEYSDIRSTKLDRVVYSSSVLMLCRMTKSEEPKVKARKEAIPEFMRFNIAEADVRNVV